MQTPYARYDDLLARNRSVGRADDGYVKEVLMDASDLVGSIARVNFPAATLTADVDETSTTISVDELSSFPKSGLLIIGEERLTYSGKSADQLAGDLENVTRAAYNSVASSHDSGDDVIVMPLDYADRRVRCEKRVFDFLWLTDGGVKKQESLTGVGARQFHTTREVRRIVRSVMGHLVKRAHRIV